VKNSGQIPDETEAKRTRERHQGDRKIHVNCKYILWMGRPTCTDKRYEEPALDKLFLIPVER
jgi:hypothetical protein